MWGVYVGYRVCVWCVCVGKESLWSKLVHGTTLDGPINSKGSRGGTYVLTPTVWYLRP